VKRLGVNIDHIATLRNARGEIHPDPVFAAKFIKRKGINSITIHLREDRRHIRDIDAKRICKIKNLKVNLEISTKKEIVMNAIKIKPDYICIVPENRKEITTEGGLNLKKNKKTIKAILDKFKKLKIRTSLFINPNLKDILLSQKLGSDCIEIHTGTFSNMVKLKKKYFKEFLKIKKCSNLAKSIGLEVHAGHGLDYSTTKLLCKIPEIEEFNIGHFIIGESIFYGLDQVIKNFKKIIN
tara:strand:- start:2908 stop:3624 length:717 start_codon:yes stop_codon:yes gene_type:complete